MQVFNKNPSFMQVFKIYEWALYGWHKLFLRYWSSDFTNKRTPLSIFLNVPYTFCTISFQQRIHDLFLPCLFAVLVCQGHVEVWSLTLCRPLKFTPIPAAFEFIRTLILPSTCTDSISMWMFPWCGLWFCCGTLVLKKHHISYWTSCGEYRSI